MKKIIIEKMRSTDDYFKYFDSNGKEFDDKKSMIKYF
jgi:hypothetical protein